MRTSTIVMIGFAVVFGLLAVFVAQSWLNRQAELRARHMEATSQPVVTRTVVVASTPKTTANPIITMVLVRTSPLPWAAEDKDASEQRCVPALNPF